VVTGAVLAWPLWTTTDGVLGPGFILALPVLGWVWGAYVSELRGRAARSRREQELQTGRAPRNRPGSAMSCMTSSPILSA
jgi:hypothetical protein